MMGVMYGISSSPDELYDYCDESIAYVGPDGYVNLATGSEWYEDEKTKYAEESLDSLKSLLESIGFEVRDAGRERFAFMFITGSQTVMQEQLAKYFEPKLQKLKELIANLDAVHFLSTDVAFDIKNLASGQYEDYVWCDKDVRTMDDFLRCLTPNTSYFVSVNTVALY